VDNLAQMVLSPAMPFHRIDLLPNYDHDQAWKSRERWAEDGDVSAKVIELIRDGGGEDFLESEFERGQLGCSQTPRTTCSHRARYQRLGQARKGAEAKRHDICFYAFKRRRRMVCRRYRKISCRQLYGRSRARYEPKGQTARNRRAETSRFGLRGCDHSNGPRS
jgi:hypothetical protein